MDRPDASTSPTRVQVHPGQCRDKVGDLVKAFRRRACSRPRLIRRSFSWESSSSAGPTRWPSSGRNGHEPGSQWSKGPLRALLTRRDGEGDEDPAGGALRTRRPSRLLSIPWTSAPCGCLRTTKTCRRVAKDPPFLPLRDAPISRASSPTGSGALSKKSPREKSLRAEIQRIS